MALDRIKKIKTANTKYKEVDFSAIDYFDEIIGVTNIKEELSQDVILKFSQNRYQYVKSKPLHGTQFDYKDADNNSVENTIGINVKFNRELLSTILSFGSDVEVLAPASLRDKVKEEVVKQLNFYNK